MFGNNHLFVLHHPKDADLLKKQAEAKKKGQTYEEPTHTFEQAQEEIAQNSGMLNYGSLTDGKDGKKSKGIVFSTESKFFSFLVFIPYCPAYEPMD